MGSWNASKRVSDRLFKSLTSFKCSIPGKMIAKGIPVTGRLPEGWKAWPKIIQMLKIWSAPVNHLKYGKFKKEPWPEVILSTPHVAQKHSPP